MAARTHELGSGGKAARAWIRSQGLSREAFCARLGISIGTLGAWEIGRAYPSLAHAVAIQRMTGIDPSVWVDALPAQEPAPVPTPAPVPVPAPAPVRSLAALMPSVRTEAPALPERKPLTTPKPSPLTQPKTGLGPRLG